LEELPLLDPLLLDLPVELEESPLDFDEDPDLLELFELLLEPDLLELEELFL